MVHNPGGDSYWEWGDNPTYTLVFQIPPEVCCFRYVLGGLNTLSGGVSKPRDSELVQKSGTMLCRLPTPRASQCKFFSMKI